jgi:hypothetical protein
MTASRRLRIDGACGPSLDSRPVHRDHLPFVCADMIRSREIMVTLKDTDEQIRRLEIDEHLYPTLQASCRGP